MAGPPLYWHQVRLEFVIRFGERFVVDSADNRDSMILHCETPGERSEALTEAIAASLRDVCKLRGEVRLVVPGALANDGKVIDDVRRYE